MAAPIKTIIKWVLILIIFVFFIPINLFTFGLYSYCENNPEQEFWCD